MMKLNMYLRGLGLGMAVTALVLGLGGKNETMSDDEVRARALQLGMVENRKLADSRPSDEKESTQEDMGSTQETEELKEETKESKPGTEGSTQETVGSTEKTVETSSGVAGTSDSDASRTDQAASKAVDAAISSSFEEGSSSAPGRDASGADKNQQASSDGQDRISEENSGNPGITGKTEETVVPPVNGDSVMITVKRGDNSWTVSKSLAEAGLITDAKAYDKYLCDEGFSKNICVGIYEISMDTSQEDIAKIITKRK